MTTADQQVSSQLFHFPCNQALNPMTGVPTG